MKQDLLFSIEEVCIYPKPYTNIRTRKQCNPFVMDDDNFKCNLPLFTAPMSTVVDEESYKTFEQNKINVIIPRSVELSQRVKHFDKRFVAMGLGEMEEYTKQNLDELKKLKIIKVCLDIANGHMVYMQTVIKNLKNEFGNKIIIMCGNIANPITFRYLSEAGADYIRCGIGGGSGCLTASNTGIFYPMGSLILKCRKIQKQMEESFKLNGGPKPAKIVADGGMKNYDFIIKAFYLGADYAMCGRIFSQCWATPGIVWSKSKEKQDIPSNWEKIGSSTNTNIEFQPLNFDYKKRFYGMSTKIAQQEIAKGSTCDLKTSEGIVKEVIINNTIHGWAENFMSYLTSAMSYTDCKTIEEVRKFEQYRLMTTVAQGSYNR